MYLIGRIAKAFGKTPLQLASEYGVFDPSFLDGLSPYDRVFIDHHILNRLITAENEAQEKAMKNESNRAEMDSHPGLKKRLTIDDILERQRGE
jgi:hypothetical protein